MLLNARTQTDAGIPEASLANTRPTTGFLGAFLGLATLLLAALLATGCSNNAGSQADPTKEAGANLASTAVVVGVDGNSVLLVDQDTQTPYIPTIPASGITTEDGGTIAVTALQPGNVLSIVGNGIMLESYPGQYPGITSITLIETGSPEDVAEYSALFNQVFSSEPTETSVPMGFVEYDSDYGRTTIALEAYNYSWNAGNGDNTSSTFLDESFADDNGILSALCPSALVGGKATASIAFEQNFQSLTINRTPLESIDDDEAKVALKATENPVQSEVVNNGSANFEMEPGYVYKVTVKFARGEASYAFYTTE